MDGVAGVCFVLVLDFFFKEMIFGFSPCPKPTVDQEKFHLDGALVFVQ